MARTRRRRAISRKRYRARGGMSESKFSHQAEALQKIVTTYTPENKGNTGKTAQLQFEFVQQFKKPILASLDGDQKERRKAIENAIDEYIDAWLARSNTKKTGVIWDRLYNLLFPE